MRGTDKCIYEQSEAPVHSQTSKTLCFSRKQQLPNNGNCKCESDAYRTHAYRTHCPLPHWGCWARHCEPSAPLSHQVTKSVCAKYKTFNKKSFDIASKQTHRTHADRTHCPLPHKGCWDRMCEPRATLINQHVKALRCTEHTGGPSCRSAR